jgi:hypothetical protein
MLETIDHLNLYLRLDDAVLGNIVLTLAAGTFFAEIAIIYSSFRSNTLKGLILIAAETGASGQGMEQIDFRN